jgi:hypothetical protein
MTRSSAQNDNQASAILLRRLSGATLAFQKQLFLGRAEEKEGKKDGYGLQDASLVQGPDINDISAVPSNSRGYPDACFIRPGPASEYRVSPTIIIACALLMQSKQL